VHRRLASLVLAIRESRVVEQIRVCVMNARPLVPRSYRTLTGRFSCGTFPGTSCLATFIESLRDKADRRPPTPNRYPVLAVSQRDEKRQRGRQSDREPGVKPSRTHGARGAHVNSGYMTNPIIGCDDHGPNRPHNHYKQHAGLIPRDAELHSLGIAAQLLQFQHRLIACRSPAFGLELSEDMRDVLMNRPDVDH
jgi:hypothetical protein